jgi:hypothetical protein
VGRGGEVGEIESEAASEEVMRVMGHVTSSFLQSGYTRNDRTRKRAAFALRKQRDR